jgi:hypothetical protein
MLVVQFFIQFDLFGERKLAAAAATPFQAESAAVIRTPLAVVTIRTGMLFLKLIAHQ